MRLLQRYVFMELVRAFTLVVTGLTILLVFLGVFREASEHGLGPVQILEILPFIVPSLLPFTIPATMLLTVSVVYGRLAGDQEITAAKAAGVPVFALIWPSLLLAGGLSVGSLMLSDRVIPWAGARIEQTVVNAVEDIFLERLRTRLQYADRRAGVVITVRGVEGRRLLTPTFHYRPAGGTTKTLRAEEATLHFDMQAREVVLTIQGGYADAQNVHVWSPHNEFRFPLPYSVRSTNPRHLPIASIEQELQSIEATSMQRQDALAIQASLAFATGEFDMLGDADFAGWQTEDKDNRTRHQKLSTEIHSRYALASSCLFFVWVGSPFSILQARRQFLTSFMLCFGPIVVVYYPVVLLTMSQCKAGHLDPRWAMWLGNALLLLAGCYFLRKLTRS